MKQFSTQLHPTYLSTVKDTFEDKPAFINRLIKVPVAIRTCSWYIAAAAETTDTLIATTRELRFPLCMNLLQRMI